MGPPYIYPPVRTTVLLPDNDFLYIGLKTPSPEKRKSVIESHFLQKKEEQREHQVYLREIPPDSWFYA